MSEKFNQDYEDALLLKYQQRQLWNIVGKANYAAAKHNLQERITVKQVLQLFELFDYRCAYCQQQMILGIDHMIPFSRYGSNTIDNIVPCCSSCNRSKGCFTSEEYLEWLGANR